MTRTSFTAALLLGVMVSLFCAPTTQAQVYKKVLEDGTVVYTDKKGEGAEEVQVESVVSEFAPVKRTPTTSEAGADTTAADVAENEAVEASIAITSPAHEATIRSNQGIVEVTWAAQTRNVQGQLGYELWVDNQLAYQGPAQGVTLSDLNRGEHRLRVRLFDESGSQLAVSDTTVIFIHQASIYNPALNSNGVAIGGASGQN